MADFAPLESPKLISRKIWETENYEISTQCISSQKVFDSRIWSKLPIAIVILERKQFQFPVKNWTLSNKGQTEYEKDKCMDESCPNYAEFHWFFDTVQSMLINDENSVKSKSYHDFITLQFDHNTQSLSPSNWKTEYKYKSPINGQNCKALSTVGCSQLVQDFRFLIIYRVSTKYRPGQAISQFPPCKS